MKPSNRFIFNLILIILCVFLGYNNVDAAGYPYNESRFPACKDSTCLSLCAYQNDNFNANEKENTSIYVYYDFTDGNIYVNYFTYQTDITNALHKTEFNNKIVLTDSTTRDNLVKYGQCPKSAFVDSAELFNLNTNVCFEKDDGYCKTSLSAIGTKFRGASSRKYNYEGYITIYFNEKTFEDISCTEYPVTNLSEEELKTKFDEDISNKLTNDFKNNFTHGYGIPTFIKENEIFKRGYQDALERSVKKFQGKCLAEINQSENISDEDKEKYNDYYNNHDENQLQENVEQAVDDMTYEINKNTIEFDNLKKCSAILTGRVSKMLTNVMDFIKYLGPILVAVFTIIDLVKGIISGEQDTKKVWQKFIKRLIAAIAIFFVIQVVEILLRILGITTVSDCFNIR